MLHVDEQHQPELEWEVEIAISSDGSKGVDGPNPKPEARATEM